jgi:predicted permease
MNTTRARDPWTWLGSFMIDFRLALRMLARYPLLSIVGSVGMAFGIAAGVSGFEIRMQFVDPTLPLEDGHRLVGLRNWDIRRDSRGPLPESDFRSWFEQVTRVEDLSAARLVERNLDVDGAVEPIDIAEMTASGFRVARVPARLGRTLIEGDESPGAPPVAVIGHALWQRRFMSDPRAVGRTVRLGSEPTTIVGVMPDGFGFPVAHQMWTPLRRRMTTAPIDETSLLVFGRLAPDVTSSEAQAELTTIGQRMAIDRPDTHKFLRPDVVPYAHAVYADPRDFQIGLALANVFLNMLVLVVAANVALLIFARAASREREIGVRTALGASRSRIVAQLFVEALALSGLSAILGLVVSRYALGWLFRARQADTGNAMPFWMSDSLTSSTIAYAVGLTMLAAVIIGVFPALQITGRGLLARLRQSTGGGGGYRFGGVWTAVIATQVALTVMFPATAFFFHRWVVAGQTRDVGLAAEQYLSARLVMDRAATLDELRRQLSAEPGVTSVAFADRLPGMQHRGARFEVEGDDAPPTYGYEVRVASIDADFFGAVGAPALSGRTFTLADIASGREVAIVNASFVERVSRGRNPVGRRIRLVSRDSEQPPGPWVDVVGVVRDLGVIGTDGIGVYRPLAPANTVHVALHVGGAPESFAGRLRAVASRVDPTLRVYDVMPLDEVGADQWDDSQYASRITAVLSGMALLLSLMAIYAVMAFTVVQRTREIGTRVALGANPSRIVAAIVRRPLVQIGLGIGAGSGLVTLMFFGMFDSTPTPLEASLIAAYAVLMLAVCLSACIVPLRRALRLEPSQVLRADA